MKKTIALFVFIVCNALAYGQADVENSKDYPILDRLPNFDISRYSDIEFDAGEFYYERKQHRHEGRKFIIQYRHRNSADKTFRFPSRLQILRNYSNAITKAGGRILFERSNAEHGYYSFKSSDQKVIWIKVSPASTGKSYKLMIIEEEEMRQDIVIDAELIKNSIEVHGKIAVYGILFDTGKSEIKEASAPALQEIATYLLSNPTINCWVVGHTDSDGSFQTNSALSLARAKAIKAELHATYKIAEKRLFAEGVGPLAPIASNASEEGKKLNRRVELVKK